LALLIKTTGQGGGSGGNNNNRSIEEELKINYSWKEQIISVVTEYLEGEKSTRDDEYNKIMGRRGCENHLEVKKLEKKFEYEQKAFDSRIKAVETSLLQRISGFHATVK
jgi:hypothetical protein